MSRNPFNSLFARLILATLLILAVFFTALDFAARHIFTANVYAARLAELKLQGFILLSAAGIDEDRIYFPERIPEPRFLQPDSGLYGIISDQDGDILWLSPSALGLAFLPAEYMAPALAIGDASLKTGARYLSHHQVVKWELRGGQQERITFSVLQDITPANNEIANYLGQIRNWFLPATTALVIALVLSLRFGLNPLRQLASNLKAIERGERLELGDDYPRELRPVSRNLNALLLAERQQRQRYQHTLANLAHSIKTPLAVIQNELESHPRLSAEDAMLLQQVQRIDDIVQHQLQRAVITSPHALTEAVPVRDCCQQLLAALQKVYADKPIEFTLAVSEDTVFKGDQRDLMEVLGNLLDNACKACRKQIRISSEQNHGRLLLVVEDDGPGIPAAMRQKVLLRGTRSDSNSPGQGLGLDTVADIVDSYQGKIHIDSSDLGGALFRLSFPGPRLEETD